jgi:hypothetical protein
MTKIKTYQETVNEEGDNQVRRERMGSQKRREKRIKSISENSPDREDEENT